MIPYKIVEPSSLYTICSKFFNKRTYKKQHQKQIISIFIKVDFDNMAIFKLE